MFLYVRLVKRFIETLNEQNKIQGEMLMSKSGTTTMYNYIINRMSVLIEVTAASHDANLMAEVQSLVKVVINVRDTETVNMLAKNIKKLTMVCSKSSIQGNFGLVILSMFTASSVRSYLPPFAKNVRNLCKEIFLNNSMNLKAKPYYYITRGGAFDEIAARLFADYTSLESTEIWGIVWNELCLDLSKALASIGILTLPSTLSADANVKDDNSDDRPPHLINHTQFSELRGANKANAVVAYYCALCESLRQMILCGCSTGTLQIDLTAFVAVTTHIIGMHVDINSNDAAVRYDIRLY